MFVMRMSGMWLQLQARALGAEVTASLTPGQAFVGIINKELVALMAGDRPRFELRAQPPVVVLLAGVPAVLSEAAFVTNPPEEQLLAIFDATVTGFERKRYVSLSREANKAMNLNSYIGLMGGGYHTYFVNSGSEATMDASSGTSSAT